MYFYQSSRYEFASATNLEQVISQKKTDITGG